MGYAIQWVRSVLFFVQMYTLMPVFGLVFAPLVVLKHRGAQVAPKLYSRWVFWTASWMVGLKCEVRGTPPPDIGCLVPSKHQSFLDIMMLFTALPAGKFIMKKEILWMPVIGQYARFLNCIPVDRGKRGEAIKKMKADVAAGMSEPGQLIIYSQGTRVAPGSKVPYKIGTGVLYEQLGQTAYPVATNVGVFWPKHGIYRKPGVAAIEFLEPIPPGLDKDTFMKVLEDRVEAASDRLAREGGFHAKD